MPIEAQKQPSLSLKPMVNACSKADALILWSLLGLFDAALLGVVQIVGLIKRLNHAITGFCNHDVWWY